jgi:hypothetical protein
MLNKEFCKRCHVQYFMGNRWTVLVDNQWEENKLISCPLALHNSFEFPTCKISDPPPEWCPYALEHVLNETK